MNLYAYNPAGDELQKADINFKLQIEIVIEHNKLKSVEQAAQEINVDRRWIHYEALNWRTANERLKKYKSGKIKDLCNLKPKGEKQNMFKWF